MLFLPGDIVTPRLHREPAYYAENVYLEPGAKAVVVTGQVMPCVTSNRSFVRVKFPGPGMQWCEAGIHIDNIRRIA